MLLVSCLSFQIYSVMEILRNTHLKAMSGRSEWKWPRGRDTDSGKECPGSIVDTGDGERRSEAGAVFDRTWLAVDWTGDGEVGVSVWGRGRKDQ